MQKDLYYAIATLTGFTIGAGILGIPFVIAQAGFITGMIDILIIGMAILMVNLYLGEVSLRTKGNHQLTGYAEKYLGKLGKKIMSFTMVFGLYGGLIAYTIKEGEFLANLFGPIFGGSILLYSLIFLFVGSIFIFGGIRAIKNGELYMVLLIIIILLFFSIFSFNKVIIKNLTGFTTDFFLPYGVILFAYLATAAIPELREELGKNKDLLKKAIMIGTIIPIIIYMLFAFIIVGVTGTYVTDGAIIGLGEVLGNNILILGLIFGILTMATSFLAVGLALKEMFNFDFKVNTKLSSSLVIIVPLIAALILINSKISNPFFQVLDITGVISGGLAGALIVLMHYKAKKQGNREPEYSIKSSLFLSTILILMFLLGIILELFTFF